MSSSRRDFLGASALSFLAALSPFKQGQAAVPKAFPLLDTEDWAPPVKTPDYVPAPQRFHISPLSKCRVAIRGRTGSLLAGRTVITYPADVSPSSLFPCMIQLSYIISTASVTRSFVQTMGDIGHGRELIVYLDSCTTNGYVFKRPILTESSQLVSESTPTELLDAYGENAGKPIRINPDDRVVMLREMTLLCVNAPDFTTEADAEFAKHSNLTESQPRPALHRKPMTPQEQAEYDKQVIAGANANVDLAVWENAGVDLQDPASFPVARRRRRRAWFD